MAEPQWARAASAAAKARVGRQQRFGAAVVAARRLPCDARSCGPSRNSLRSLRSLRSDSRDESVGGRASRWPQALRFSALLRRAAAGPHAPLQHHGGVRRNRLHLQAVSESRSQGPSTANRAAAARRAVRGGGDFCGDEKRRPGVGARSALRQHARRHCLSAVSGANAASLAMRPQAEHRSGVGAQRRPPQHEPPARTACRAAPNSACPALPRQTTQRHPPPRNDLSSIRTHPIAMKPRGNAVRDRDHRLRFA